MIEVIQKNIAVVIAFVIMAAASVSSVLLLSPAVSAQNKDELCQGASLTLSKPASGQPDRCDDSDGDGTADTTGSAESKLNRLIKTIVNILSTIIGIIAVIFIILGGAKYITSGGDSGKVSSAKNTVIYAIVGLIIVALAQVIVRFVLGKVG